MNFLGLTEERIVHMKQAGFRKLKMGLESASSQTLARIKKGVTVERIIELCKKASTQGLEIHLTIMFGFPWEKKEDALRTLRLADMLMRRGWIHMLQATVLVPYPGTELYQEGIVNDWFLFSPSAYERFDMAEPVS